MILKPAVALALLLLIPACTTPAPEVESARGLLMCTCGERHYIIYEGGKLEVITLERSTGVDLKGGLDV